MANNPQDIQPLGGSPLGAPDYPDSGGGTGGGETLSGADTIATPLSSGVIAAGRALSGADMIAAPISSGTLSDSNSFAGADTIGAAVSSGIMRAGRALSAADTIAAPTTAASAAAGRKLSGATLIAAATSSGILVGEAAVVVRFPDPTYDLQAAIETLMPGVVVQRNLLDAAAARYASKNFLPLGSGDVAAILSAANELDETTVAARYAPTTQAPYATTLPVYPTKLPRFPDSNPDPFDQWVEFGPELAGPAP